MKNPRTNRKILLLRAGTTQKDIALSLGVTPQAISMEMAGRKKSRRIRQALCEVTGTTEREFFPEIA
jgi:transcriptional regulator with XRE-family HTH domain